MNPLIEKYKDYPDERLLEIIYHKKDYRKEAVDAAEYWVASRGFSAKDIQQVQQVLKKREAAKLAEIQTPLKNWEKVLFVLIPFMGLPVLFITNVRNTTGKKSSRAHDAGLFSLIGLVIWGVIAWAIAG